MKISEEKRKKISEQILAYLYSINPQAVFTADIAKEIVRDEEFTKKLLQDLRKKGLVNEIKKNAEGTPYLKRSRWKLSNKAYKAYRMNLS